MISFEYATSRISSHRMSSGVAEIGAWDWTPGQGSLHSERVDTLVLFRIQRKALRLNLESLQILVDRHLDFNSLPQGGSDLITVQLLTFLRLAVKCDCQIGRLYTR